MNAYLFLMLKVVATWCFIMRCAVLKICSMIDARSSESVKSDNNNNNRFKCYETRGYSNTEPDT